MVEKLTDVNLKNPRQLSEADRRYWLKQGGYGTVCHRLSLLILSATIFLDIASSIVLDHLTELSTEDLRLSNDFTVLLITRLRLPIA